MRHDRPRLGRVLGAVAALASLAAGLWWAGHGRLASPPATSWQSLGAWYESTGPDVATMVALRLGALVISLWLLLGALLEAWALSVGGPLARVVADRIAPRALQHLLQGVAGASFAAGLVLPAPGGAPGEAATVAVALLEAPPPGSAGTATLRLLDPAPAAAPQDAIPAVPATPAVPARSPGVVTVASGECFWSISARVMAERLGRPPQDSEIVPHWHRLVDANRERLVDRTNPDLLYPGQELVLPAG